MDRDFLTVQETAQRLKYSTATVRALIKSGKLPASRPTGGRYRLDPDDVERFGKGIVAVEGVSA